MSSADQSSGPLQPGPGPSLPGLEQPTVIITGDNGKPHINPKFIEFADSKSPAERERLIREAERDLEEALEKFRQGQGRDEVRDDNN